MKRRNDSRKGMSLVEITIVLVVLLVIFGAVFLFFTRGTEHFEFSRRQNELTTIGRLALEEVTDVIIYAGYMPNGGWDNDEWHPVTIAVGDQLEFYADWEERGVKPILNTDYRLVTISDERFTISDHAGDVDLIGSNITSLDFGYLDELGNPLSEPLDSLDRDLVRHVQISIELSDTWGEQTYTTEVHTTISPRNLGMNHNINPAFWPPPDLEGLIVFNVPGTGEDHNPTDDEALMINRLLFWGLSVKVLNDDEMETYDFISEGINLIVLRHRDTPGVFPHGDIFNNPLAAPLEVPVVTLNARDAVDIFAMAIVCNEQINDQMTPANNWHPVNRNLPEGFDTFFAYELGSFGVQSVLDSLIYNSPGDTLLTYSEDLPYLSGVCVRDETTQHRRVHFSAYDASEYTSDGGWQIFYNVIAWGIGEPPTEYGTLLEEEDFENPEDYSDVEPGYTGDSWCHLISPSVDIPAETDGGYTDPIMRFTHVYWLRNKNQGVFLEISTDSSTWDYIGKDILDPDYYKIKTGSDYPGGMMLTYREKSDGYFYPGKMEWTTVEVDLEDYAGETLWFRFVFGAVPIPSNNQDGYVIDNFSAWATSNDTGLEERIDFWGDDFDLWKHDLHEQDTLLWTDNWAYLDLNETDEFYPDAWGKAWTTWGTASYIGPWSHGGINNSWEIGVTALFWPKPDPQPTPENGAHYAGNALTFNEGYYYPGEASWLLSERYEMSSTLSYDIIRLVFYRCVGLAPMDDCWVHLAFSNDTIPPDCNDLSQWVEVRRYDGEDQKVWEEEMLDVSTKFKEDGDSMDYYWMLFTLISGPNNERGGWNLDNIEIYGANII